MVEFEMPAAKVPIGEDQAVGFDMVLEPPNFLVRSDGEEVHAPRYYRARERKLRRPQRRVSRAQKGSRNRAKARRRVAKSMNARRTCAMSFCTSCLLSWS